MKSAQLENIQYHVTDFLLSVIYYDMDGARTDEATSTPASSACWIMEYDAIIDIEKMYTAFAKVLQLGDVKLNICRHANIVQ
jgi:hypothetical protein